jgi:hypothetical protein
MKAFRAMLRTRLKTRSKLRCNISISVVSYSSSFEESSSSSLGSWVSSMDNKSVRRNRGSRPLKALCVKVRSAGDDGARLLKHDHGTALRRGEGMSRLSKARH